jgi:hypothetical protein
VEEKEEGVGGEEERGRKKWEEAQGKLRPVPLTMCEPRRHPGAAETPFLKKKKTEGEEEREKEPGCLSQGRRRPEARSRPCQAAMYPLCLPCLEPNHDRSCFVRFSAALPPPLQPLGEHHFHRAVGPGLRVED